MSIDVKKLLETAISNVEDSRPRNLQKSIGPSSLGGCSRKVWLQLQGQKPVNETERMAAWMGTAIHAAIAEGLKMDNLFDEPFLIEHPVERDGIIGNVDLFVKEYGAVVDWKSTKKSGVRYFPKDQQVWQVQVYGWMLTGMGYDVKTVSLCAIPRDGVLKDVVVHTEPYDEAKALEAIKWLEDIKATDEAPAPEMKAAQFCQSYCQFWTPDGSVCPGL